MKLIIEIPDDYEELFWKERCKSKFNGLATNEFGYVLRKAFENGAVYQVGHWIDVEGGVECSECGHWYPHASIAKARIKYCSECGVKLEVRDADRD